MISEYGAYDLETPGFYKYMEQIADNNWAWEDPDNVDSYICSLDVETLQSHWERYSIEYWWSDKVEKWIIRVDISDGNSHMWMLLSIMKQLEKLEWASIEEIQSEWTTLLKCMEKDPEFHKWCK